MDVDGKNLSEKKSQIPIRNVFFLLYFSIRAIKIIVRIFMHFFEFLSTTQYFFSVY